MTKRKYYYSLLRYIPDYSLGEQITIGIFYWFVDDNVCQFIYPDNLQRAKYFYPAANLNTLHLYLNRYKEMANIFNPRTEKIDNPDALLTHLYGPINAVSLIFDKPKIGYYDNVEQIITTTNKLFFANYNITAAQKIEK
jgi:hypothetical protein